MKIPGQSRTLACLGFSYVTKIAAVAVLLLAIGGVCERSGYVAG